MKKKCFMWAVMYQPNLKSKPHVVKLYPTERDAKVEVYQANKRWKDLGYGHWHWNVKRFVLYFRGDEIDAYDHEWLRTEKVT